jgi:putative lipoic acid-binding regulatory protein
MSEQNPISQEEFYKKFKERLNDTTDFPSNYTFKFIVPTDHKRIAEVQKIFDDARPQFQMKESKTGKYTSVTVVIYALDADQVIYYYKEAASIEDVMMM